MKKLMSKIKSVAVAYPPSEASFSKQSGYRGALTMGLTLGAQAARNLV